MTPHAPLKKLNLVLLALSSSLVMNACDSDDDADPALYQFNSRFSAGESSVSYSGQIARHVLINDLNSEISSGLQVKIDSGIFSASSSASDVEDVLNLYYQDGTDVLDTQSLALTTSPSTLQTSYIGISSGKNLQGKIAGNDSATDHKDWDDGTSFVGGTAASPNAQIAQWFGEIAANVVTEAQGTSRALPVYVMTDGRDLKQLVQKFLLGAVAYSQGTDDYFDDATDGKGLLTDNTVADDDGAKPYTTLEHQWDEGYGYFGAARNYNYYTDDEIAAKGGRDAFASGYNDSNNDGAIDLNAEFNFGHSQNAAKRDRGATVATNFTKGAFDAFVAGRALITAANGDLSDAQMTVLQGYRNTVVLNWEMAIAATVIHYINDTLADMDNFGTDDYSFNDHAKHWSEMKGFALGLQFNPRSQVSDENFAQMQNLMGDAPVLSDADDTAIAQYRADLLTARDILETAYNFNSINVENW